MVPAAFEHGVKSMQNIFSGVTNWEFLNEPLYRWAIFFGAIMLIAWGWNGVLGYMH